MEYSAHNDMKYIRLMAEICCFVVTAVFLQVTNSFHFYYIEQLQLFRYAVDYWAAQVAEVGGVAALLGELLTQYFAYPYVGPVVIAALLTGIFWLTAEILRRIQARALVVGVVACAFPVVDAVRFQLSVERNGRFCRHGVGFVGLDGVATALDPRGGCVDWRVVALCHSGTCRRIVCDICPFDRPLRPKKKVFLSI